METSMTPRVDSVAEKAQATHPVTAGPGAVASEPEKVGAGSLGRIWVKSGC